MEIEVNKEMDHYNWDTCNKKITYCSKKQTLALPSNSNIKNIEILAILSSDSPGGVVGVRVSSSVSLLGVDGSVVSSESVVVILSIVLFVGNSGFSVVAEVASSDILSDVSSFGFRVFWGNSDTFFSDSSTFWSIASCEWPLGSSWVKLYGLASGWMPGSLDGFGTESLALRRRRGSILSVLTSGSSELGTLRGWPDGILSVLTGGSSELGTLRGWPGGILSVLTSGLFVLTEFCGILCSLWFDRVTVLRK